MKKKEFIVLPKDESLTTDYAKLAEEVEYVIVPVQDGLAHQDKACKEVICGLRSAKIPFGVSATVNATNEHDMRDEAVRYYKRAEGLGVTKDQWFFVEVTGETMPDMRAGVAHFVRSLKEAGVEHVGLRIKHHMMKKLMLDLTLFDVVDAIEHEDPNDHHLDQKAFHHPGMHEFTDNAKVAAIEGRISEGHCENGFTVGQLTAEKHCNRFYKKAPYAVKVKESIPFYRDENLKEEVGKYPTGEVLHLKDIHCLGGHRTSVKTKEGTWILAQKDVLISTYYECPCLIGREIEAKVDVIVYSAAEFDNQNRMREDRAGKKFKVKGIAYDHAGTPRFEINEEKDGHPLYVSASKEDFTIL